jgi:hypothetical protein
MQVPSKVYFGVYTDFPYMRHFVGLRFTSMAMMLKVFPVFTPPLADAEEIFHEEGNFSFSPSVPSIFAHKKYSFDCSVNKYPRCLLFAASKGGEFEGKLSRSELFNAFDCDWS